jgi:hypothetical protein
MRGGRLEHREGQGEEEEVRRALRGSGNRARALVLFLTTGSAALVAPSTGSAAVTIGEDTSTPPNASPFFCGVAGQSCTFAQTVHPTRSYAAPFDGVIVRWRIRGDSAANQFWLRVLHKNDGTFTGVRTSEPRNVAPGIENAFETALPISQGEFIGLNLRGASDTPHVERRTVPGASLAIWAPTALQDGETRAPNSSGSLALIYNADVEPDCDSDGLGDETQDPQLPLSEACGKGNRTITLDANKNKVKKGKRVTLAGQVNQIVRQGPCESTQTVQLQRKKPSQATFTTIEQLQTDAAGSFTTKEKVKKTYEYRAQVAETEACLGQTSNTEKVKVKKKK